MSDAVKPTYIHPFAQWGLPLSLFGFAAWSLADFLDAKHISGTPARVLGWMLLLAGTGLIAAAIFKIGKIRKQLTRLSARLCPTCSYDLRATPDRCPECGLAPSIPCPAN